MQRLRSHWPRSHLRQEGGGEAHCIGCGWVGRSVGRLSAAACRLSAAVTTLQVLAQGRPATSQRCGVRVTRGFQPPESAAWGSHGELYREGRRHCLLIVRILSIFVFLLLLRVPLLLPKPLLLFLLLPALVLAPRPGHCVELDGVRCGEETEFDRS